MRPLGAGATRLAGSPLPAAGCRVPPGPPALFRAPTRPPQPCSATGVSRPRLAQDGRSPLPAAAPLAQSRCQSGAMCAGGRLRPGAVCVTARAPRTQPPARLRAALFSKAACAAEGSRREEAEARQRCLRGGERFWKPGCAVCVAGAPCSGRGQPPPPPPGGSTPFA